jgi:hypothetical protein
MIQIKSNSTRNLEAISENYYQEVKRSVELRIKRLIAPHWLKLSLTDHLYKIITGIPEELWMINGHFYSQARKRGYRKELLDSKLKNVFIYDWLANNKQRAYAFADRLQVNTCPYCNRNYTVTVIKKKRTIVRPDFDHFFPQSEYPLLALSFYNLIPSCLLCNRTIKGFKSISLGKYIHPYQESYGVDLKINYFPKDTDSALGIKRNLDIRVLLSKTNATKARRCEATFNLFKLKEIYEVSHLDEISDIIRKYHISGGRYLKILRTEFPKLGSLEELYKIAFGNYYHEDEFENRPLAKLTKDMVEQLNFGMPKFP